LCILYPAAHTRGDNLYRLIVFGNVINFLMYFTSCNSYERRYTTVGLLYLETIKLLVYINPADFYWGNYA
jgi:hypothetical protein